MPKISQVAKELHVGIATIVEHLAKNGVEVSATNLNARINDEQYELLKKIFHKDMMDKVKSDQLTNDRQGARKTTSAQEETPKEQRKEEKTVAAPKPETKKQEDAPTTKVRQPNILGKIELDKKGMPVKSAPEQPKKDDPVPAQPAPAPEQPKQEPKPEPKQEPKPEPEKPQPKEEPKPKEEQPKEQPKPKNEPKNEPAKENKPTPTPEPAKEDKNVEVSDDNDSASKTDIKVVGFIDLASINTTTRPKKKSKEEKRRERMEKERSQQEAQNTAATNTGDGERKKRKRIGKERVDIEKIEKQQNNKNGGRNGKQGKNGNNGNNDEKRPKDNRKKGNHGPFKNEVSEEDVQRQVKETLARLTKKPQQKGAQWRKEKREAAEEREQQIAVREAAEEKVLKLTEFVTANDLASMMNVPINKVIGTCMSLGVMVSINQRLDAETINIVAEEFGFKTEYVSAELSEAIQEVEDNEEDLEERPPVVTVMGHVDHGKTSLLDYIRKANVIAGEAGGITQHIGAYNVKLPNGRRITFLDTPGHEAFTAMRARGAKVTDIVIIIVAADDDVMPQTIEAINHATAAGVPIVFAINKVDKPTANPDKIKEKLAAMNYLVEEWGGKYQSQDISAKKGIGVEELMEKVLLEADLLELKANPRRNAVGSIIESSLDKGRGYVATVLVQNGTLHVGDIVLAGRHFGKVKAMFNERNARIQQAGPATPVLILGLDGAPTAGDKFNVMDTEQEAREIANKREQLQREQLNRTQKRRGLEDIARLRALGSFHELNVIVKGDVDGSIEALSDSLIKLSIPEVEVKVIHKAVGAISESDVILASASNAYIIGFQVRPSLEAKRVAEREGVDIRLYSVIYDAIEEVKQAMEGMLAPEVKEDISGSAEVRETFHISKVGTIAGAIVREGKIKKSCKVRVIRDGIVRYTGVLGSLKRFKDDVKEVVIGQDCGISVQGFNDIEVGDILECFDEIEIKKSL